MGEPKWAYDNSHDASIGKTLSNNVSPALLYNFSKPGPKPCSTTVDSHESDSSAHNTCVFS